MIKERHGIQTSVFLRQIIDAESVWATLRTEREEVLSDEKSKENETYIKRTTKLISYLQYTSE